MMHALDNPHDRASYADEVRLAQQVEAILQREPTPAGEILSRLRALTPLQAKCLNQAARALFREAGMIVWLLEHDQAISMQLVACQDLGANAE